MKPLRFQFGARPLPEDPREAAEWWLARRHLGSLPPREEAVFQAWAAEPANAAAYARLEAALGRAAAHAAEPEILRIRASALAARPVVESAGVRVAASIAGLLLLAAAATVWTSPGLREQISAPAGGLAANAGVKRYETVVGEHRRLELDDGSVVFLNTGSLLEISLTGRRRDARLIRGEALFEVAHNANWPFVVTAGDRQVTAVGTAFDVRLDGPAVKVVLVEGKVRVTPLRPTGLARVIPTLAQEQLTSGEELVSQAGSEASTVAMTDVHSATSWKDGQLIFRDDTLAAAVAELNRYSRRRILIEDPRVAGLKVSGVFSTSRPENFVAAVTTFYPIEARDTAAGVTELASRDQGWSKKISSER